MTLHISFGRPFIFGIDVDEDEDNIETSWLYIKYTYYIYYKYS